MTPPSQGLDPSSPSHQLTLRPPKTRLFPPGARGIALGVGFGQFTDVFLLWFGHQLAIFRLRRAFCRAFPPNPPDRREKAAKNGWILPGRAPSQKYLPPQKYSALAETGTVVSLAQAPGTVVCLGTVLSAKSLAQWLSKNPNRSPEISAIGCPTLSFNSNYLQNGLMEFDLVCGH